MVEHCLYGVRVFSDFDLFGRQVPLTAIAPGEHDTLCLEEAGADSAPVAGLSNSIPLFSNHGRDLYLHTDRPLALSVESQPWSLEVREVVTLSWTGGEPVISYRLHGEGTRELLVFWFVHVFVPLHLTLERGWDFIHAAAVEIGGSPVLFVAPSTGGKSTLGDYFLKRGHPMLADDKVATFLHDGKYWVVPSHPHHRPFREFEVLGYPIENFAAQAGPVRAFYALEAGEPQSRVEISEVAGFRKFENLLPNYLFSFRFLKEQRMRWLAQLADQSRVFRVRRPWNLDRMHEVYEAICTHASSLGEVSA
jgi:hypothetical protein